MAASGHAVGHFDLVGDQASPQTVHQHSVKPRWLSPSTGGSNRKVFYRISAGIRTLLADRDSPTAHCASESGGTPRSGMALP
jgi:hypothetical protein